MNKIEKKHVFDIYNNISQEFSNTRKFPWPFVSKYINKLKSGSFVCDVGCGNGKNMIRPDLIYIGSDLSEEMCFLSSQKTLNVVQSNVLKLAFRDNTFDCVISIACIHHIVGVERQKNAIKECFRIISKGGTMCISVWAESEKYGHGDTYIKWNTYSKKRYYFLFNQTNFNALFNDINYNTKELVYENHNLYCIITKKI